MVRLFWLLTDSLKVTVDFFFFRSVHRTLERSHIIPKRSCALAYCSGISPCSFVQKTQKQRGAYQSVPAPAEHSGLPHTAHLEGGQRRCVPVEGHGARPSAGQPVPLSNQVRWVRLRIWPGAAQGRASAGAGSPAGPCRYALIFVCFVIFLFPFSFLSIQFE